MLPPERVLAPSYCRRCTWSDSRPPPDRPGGRGRTAFVRESRAPTVAITGLRPIRGKGGIRPEPATLRASFYLCVARSLSALQLRQKKIPREGAGCNSPHLGAALLWLSAEVGARPEGKPHSKKAVHPSQTGPFYNWEIDRLPKVCTVLLRKCRTGGRREGFLRFVL